MVIFTVFTQKSEQFPVVFSKKGNAPIIILMVPVTIKNYLSFQMSLLYSAMVRSLEKNPAFAILTSIFFCHSLRFS